MLRDVVFFVMGGLFVFAVLTVISLCLEAKERRAIKRLDQVEAVAVRGRRESRGCS
jgi:hypothetical protein